VHQQAGVLFAVVLTHRKDGSPAWLAAPNVPRVDGWVDDFVTYRGDLATTTGTAFDQPGGYRSADFRARRVGTLEMQIDAGGYHYVTYDNDAETRARSMERLAWRAPPAIWGRYEGVRTVRSVPPGSLPATRHAGRWTFSAQDGTVRLQLTEESLTCDISGRYEGDGTIGQINSAQATCTDDKGRTTTGTFFAHEIRLIGASLSMSYALDSGSGVMAGVRVD
jgi:hypothetical protein